MDLFQKWIGINLQGSTPASEQRYRLAMAVICAALGFIWLPWTAVFWVVTIVKVAHYIDALKRQGPGL